MTEERCGWSLCDLDGYWETDCNRSFSFNDGGPAENDYHYCPGCGRAIHPQTSTDG